jgi:hypothetical protein
MVLGCWDEMMIGYFDWIPQRPAAPTPPAAR